MTKPIGAHPAIGAHLESAARDMVENAPRAAEGRPILMCPPEHFDVS
jgi:hypothetical protein